LETKIKENVTLRMFCYTLQIKRKLRVRLRPHKKVVH